MTDDMEAGESAQRSRSPIHPNFDLSKAIEKVGLLYKQERMNPAARTAAMLAMGYSDKSSPGRQMLATLRQFGLLDKVPGSQVRLSRLAQRILILTAPEQEEERRAALKEAAAAPEMHQDILARYPHGLPSDASLRYYLIHDKQFVDDSADDFIREIKATFAFAGIGAKDIEKSEAEMTSPQPPTTKEQSMPTAPVAPSPSPPPPSVSETVTAPSPGRATVQLALGRGKWATLTAPESMTEREWLNLLAALGSAKVGFLIEEDEG